MEKDNLVKSFHEMWDAFPGMARLITSNHEILAANDIAAAATIAIDFKILFIASQD